MIRLLVVDDHPIVRRGLKQIIAENSDMKVTGEAEGGREALALVRANKYDAIILDISLPDLSGLDVLLQLKKERPKPAILMLSVHPEKQYAVRALKAGASGFLSKDSAPKELVVAIRAVAAGKKYVSSSLAQELASKIETAETLPFEILSDREFSVMRLIASGKTQKEIAQELFISPKTVGTYRSRILIKLGLETNAELVRYVLDNRLLD